MYLSIPVYTIYHSCMIVTQPDRVLLRQQVASLAHNLQGNILDVGGGDGKRYKSLFLHAKSFRCLDTNTELQPDILGSAEDIPLQDNSVDSVLCTQVLEHVAHPRKVLQEIHRILVPGGKALLTVPQWNELHEEPHDYYRYTCFGIRLLCEEENFSVLEVDQRGGYHACKAQLRIRYFIDRWQPYSNRVAMFILGPITKFYTSIAIWRDSIDSSTANQKHAIGWAVVIQK